MAFAVKIVRIAGSTETALYAWESTNGRNGHVLLDIGDKFFRPADGQGVPIGEMSFRVGDEDPVNPDSATVQDFLTAVSGIIRKWKGASSPPETAHLYFG
jgi:hypothetical protein